MELLYSIPPLVNPADAGNVLLLTAFALDATQLVQVPVRLVITPDVGVPKRGVVRPMLVAVVPLGSARTPVPLVLMVALPDVAPLSTTLPPVPPFVPRVALLAPVIVPASEMLPPLLSVDVAEGVWRVVVPPPVTKAVEVKEPAPTTVTVPLPAAGA